MTDAAPGGSTAVQESQPQVIDLTALLAAIPGENPSGESLQYSAPYDEIREARRADDTLNQGDWQREPKLAEWHKVIDVSTDALTNKTKDLQIAAWMTEAMVHEYGFVGLRDGLKLLRGLHDSYWDTFYPAIDGTDLEARGNALSGLDKNVEIPLKSLVITNSSGQDLNYIQWEDSTKFDIPENIESLEAAAYERATQLKQQAEAEGKTTGEMWRKAKDSSRRAFYENLNLVLNECWNEFQLLDGVMDQRFGNQTPGLGTIKKTLEAIRSVVDKLVKEKRILEPDPIPVAEGEQASGATGSGVGGSGGPISTRADALRRLAEVAEYYQRAEPHSPVAYLVQRAIKWGQMPLEVWLEDVIKDGAVLGQLKETLGFGTNTFTGDAGSGTEGS
jgi:type VI secretion system protein ImpA